MIRVKIAGKFGRIEHRAGEALGLLTWINYWYYKEPLPLVIAIVWTIYFVAHRLEKKFYGSFGPRG